MGENVQEIIKRLVIEVDALLWHSEAVQAHPGRAMAVPLPE